MMQAVNTPPKMLDVVPTAANGSLLLNVSGKNKVGIDVGAPVGLVGALVGCDDGVVVG